MNHIQAVIFDMDGTLVDSREFIFQAMEDVLAQFHVTNVTRDRMAEVTGRPIHTMYGMLAPGKDAMAMEKAHIAHHNANPHLLTQYEYVHEFLDGLRARGIKLGVFTGFDKRAYERLDYGELTPYFESIVETTRYTKHKPDPEGLLLGIRELGATPQATIYVGDGISDIGAGKNAGVAQVIAMTHGLSSRRALQEAGADRLVDSFRDLETVLGELEYGSQKR